jgi:Flp pilus assembly protein TadD
VNAPEFAGPRMRRFLGAWAAALLCGAAAFALAAFSYARLPHAQPLEELSYYPSGQHLRLATLGQDESAADLAWLRAVQYYGEHRNTDNRFERMPHVFDILTTLAPRFIPPYVFGGFALAQEGGDFGQAEALMLKGLEANPTSGRLAFELGFLYYVRPGGRDLRRAADYFEQASRQPDSPAAAARFAAFAREHAGDLRLAYELWAAVYRESPNRYLRDIAERNLRKIQAALDAGRREADTRRLPTPVVLLRKP